MTSKSIRGRPAKHSRQIRAPATWIAALFLAGGTVRDDFVMGVETLIKHWKLPAKNIRVRKSRLIKLWSLNRTNLKFAPDNRTTVSRREIIRAEAKKLQPSFSVELPLEGVLSLETFQGADYLIKCLPKRRPAENNEAVVAIARTLIFQYCKAQMVTTGGSAADVIGRLPNTFRRSARLTSAPSVSLSGLLGSILGQLELSGDVCAALSHVVGGLKRSVNNSHE